MRLKKGYPNIYVQTSGTAPAVQSMLRQLFRVIERLRDTFIDAINENGGPSMLDIARGKIEGLSGVNKFGRNEACANGTEEYIWDGGGTYAFPSSASLISLESAGAMQIKPS